MIRANLLCVCPIHGPPLEPDSLREDERSELKAACIAPLSEATFLSYTFFSYT